MRKGGNQTDLDEQRRVALAKYPAKKIRRFALGETDPKTMRARSKVDAKVRNIRTKTKAQVARSQNKRAMFHFGEKK